MPPQITFIKISKSISLPIKVFIKQQSTSDSSITKNSYAINSKSLITLSNNKFQLRLSNNYLSKIISEISSDLKRILFYDRDESVVIQNQEIKIGEKYKLFIPKQVIIEVRMRLGLLNMEQLEQYKAPKSDGLGMKLLLREKIMRVMPEEEENDSLMISVEDGENREEELEEEGEDKKKVNMDYKLRNIPVVGGLSECITLHVY
ncbi:uncharacterized protein J8A68_005402 [[Candida] subhashii]|uniref:Uncharacterized protein n=1 Tax=[Candida] subhashii TaxID=561895 RepID=A0A8J5QM48_9ASCO|nr:uncharacterized protein J8A68_005402 [[Candida] subhashii]KAG7661030.1 hypothetical protein J8A68_005402 [[Candida] subhashii]